MSALREIPELAALHAPTGVVRIPPETDVPLTKAGAPRGETE